MPVAEVNEAQPMTRDKSVKRSRGEDAVPAPGHSRGAVPKDIRTIKGWGVDLDPKNRPMVPMEFESDVTTVRGEVKDRQVPTVKIHMSNEHPDLAPVFGTSAPPKGLSGMLRDYAYEYGEGTNRHWMTLMVADRIDVVESMITDALQGRPDNYLREKGWPLLAWQTESDRRRAYTLIGGAVLSALALGVVLRSTSRS